MLTLLLQRHAKAGRPPGIGDRDRPLADSGWSDIRAVAAAGRERLARVGLVFCSPARRTRETLQGMAEFLPGEATIDYPDDLYLAEAREILAVLRHPGAEAVRLLIGHNDGLHDAASRLAGAGDPDLRNRLRSGLPTSGHVVLEFDLADWSGLAWGRGSLTSFRFPQELGLR